MVVLTFFLGAGFASGYPSGYLAAQVHAHDAGNFMQGIILNIVVERPYGNMELRVSLDNLVRRQAILKQWSDDAANPFRF